MRDSFAEELTYLQNAEQELKRIDHLIYVSLKYTRTVDVFKNVLKRLVTTGDFLKDAVLEVLHEDNVIEAIPENRAHKADLIRQHYASNDMLQEFMAFHQMLRRVDRADFTRKNEYRRHVTMTVMDGPDIMEIKIETLTDYYKRMKELYVAIFGLIEQHRGTGESDD